MLSIAEAATAFVTVFLAELPDKTMFASIVLVGRYGRPLAVWSGATLAFALHVGVAIAVGSALALVSETVVGIAVFLLFAIGAVAMGRAARAQGAADAGESAEEESSIESSSWPRAALASFMFIALAEWGDLTQLATAGLAARSESALSVGVGSLLALSTVAAMATSVGGYITGRIPVRRINLLASVLFAALACWTLVELLWGG